MISRRSTLVREKRQLFPSIQHINRHGWIHIRQMLYEFGTSAIYCGSYLRCKFAPGLRLVRNCSQVLRLRNFLSVEGRLFPKSAAWRSLDHPTNQIPRIVEE